MKREVKELKRIARGNLQGHFFGLIRAFVFCNLVVSLIELPFSWMTNEVRFSTPNIIYCIAIILVTIASVVLTVGQYCLHLRIARTGKLHLSELFYPLKHDANRLIITETILWIVRLLALSPIIIAVIIIYFYNTMKMYLFAGGLFLIGIVLTIFVEITFGLIYFVFIDNEDDSIRETLQKTFELIKNNRSRFLYLHLSFIGMYLLVALTLGIGLLWIQPYVMQTTTLFYLDTNNELDYVLETRRKQIPTPEPMSFDSYA